MTQKRLPLTILVTFVILYLAILATNLLMGVGPNLLLKALKASAGVRAYLGSTFSYAVRIAAYTILPALALKRALRIDPWGRFFPKTRIPWKDMLFGFLLVGGVLALFFVVEVQAGWLAVDGWNWQVLSASDWLRTAWVGLLVNAGVALGEESIFRGYLLSGLKAAWGRWKGLLGMMVIFGLFHLIAYAGQGFQSATLGLAIVLASLFGGLFGLVYLKTGTLWLPATLHFAWNFIENDLLNLTGEQGNVNLIGAISRLSPLLTTTELTWSNVILIETLAFALIALGMLWWMRNRKMLIAG